MKKKFYRIVNMESTTDINRELELIGSVSRTRFSGADLRRLAEAVRRVVEWSDAHWGLIERGVVAEIFESLARLDRELSLAHLFGEGEVPFAFHLNASALCGATEPEAQGREQLSRMKTALVSADQMVDDCQQKAVASKLQATLWLVRLRVQLASFYADHARHKKSMKHAALALACFQKFLESAKSSVVSCNSSSTEMAGRLYEFVDGVDLACSFVWKYIEKKTGSFNPFAKFEPDRARLVFPHRDFASLKEALADRQVSFNAILEPRYVKLAEIVQPLTPERIVSHEQFTEFVLIFGCILLIINTGVRQLSSQKYESSQKSVVFDLQSSENKRKQEYIFV